MLYFGIGCVQVRFRQSKRALYMRTQDGLKGRCAHTGEKKQRQNMSDKNWVANDVIGYLATYGYQLAVCIYTHLPY